MERRKADKVNIGVITAVRDKDRNKLCLFPLSSLIKRFLLLLLLDRKTVSCHNRDMRIEESKRIAKYVEKNNIRIGTILSKENQYYMIADIDFLEFSISLIRVQRAIFPEPHFKVMEIDFWLEKGVNKVFFLIDLSAILEYEVVSYDIDLHKRGLNYGWDSAKYKTKEKEFIAYLYVLKTVEDGVYYVGYSYRRFYLYIILKTDVEDILSTEVLSVPLANLNVNLSQINASETVEKILTEDLGKMSLLTLRGINNYNWKKEGKIRKAFDFSTYAMKVRMLCR